MLNGVEVVITPRAIGVLSSYVVMGLVAQVVPSDPISGHAGWVGAGLLGAVLGWLLFIHLPAKDKQLKDFVAEKDGQVELLVKANLEEREKLTDRYDAERERERDARHKRANEFQTLMAQMAVTFQVSLKSVEEGHRIDAEKDRAAFLSRNTRVEDAIKIQTAEIKAALVTAMAGSCRYALPRLPEKLDPPEGR